jgi:hypothetical protein
MNGLFPDIAGTPRRDGLVVRITDNLAPFGLVGLGASFGFQPPHFALELIGTLIGHSFIGGGAGSPAPILLAAAGLQNGAREFTIAMPNTIPPALVGTDIAFQGLVWDINIDLAEWTNAQEVHL